MFDIQNKVVVVTGGLGQLGLQFCSALIKNGARVACLDMKTAAESDDIISAHKELACMKDMKEQFFYCCADVTDKNSLEDSRVAIESHFCAPVYGLINNAALDAPPDSSEEETGPFETYPLESWERVFNVNATGPFLCCQVFGKSMVKAEDGSIINIGSIYGTHSPDQALYQYRRDRGETFFKPVAYSASKSSLYNLTRYLAAYWGKRKIRVNIVTFSGVHNDQDQAFLERYLPKIPLGRMAEANEYNGVIVFLMSSASQYMTGSNVVIDGGFSAL